MINLLIEDIFEAESTLVNTLNEIRQIGPINLHHLELLSYIKFFHSDMFSKYESQLMFYLGLFYKTKKPESLVDFVYNEYALTIIEETKMNLTAVQADIFLKFKDSEIFSFSAPASAGKSYLLKEILATDLGDIVIVVPSRALIAEYVNDIKERVQKDVLVMPFIERVNIKHTRRNIFIITPERGIELFQHKEKFNISFFFFDEAQISEEQYRGLTFDSFVRRVDKDFPKSKKIFAQPYVDNPEGQLKKHNYVNNSVSESYKQNTVGKIFMYFDNFNFSYFTPFGSPSFNRPIRNDFIEDLLKNDKTFLIYASKNKINQNYYLRYFKRYFRLLNKITDPNAINLIQQMREYIGVDENEKKSIMIELMGRGVVIHHGSMPLKMRYIIEDFIRLNFAKICLATSTLQQGINMPFDAVYIDNFYKMDELTLKNLIGRSGRSTDKKNTFDFGYTIINKKNLETFTKRIKLDHKISETSRLDEDYDKLDEDYIDLVEATKANTFSEKLHITELQLERIAFSNNDDKIELILRLMFDDNTLITHKQYIELNEQDNLSIKNAFKSLYLSHLRRKELTQVEIAILNTAITIFLWKVQGKSFKEILALRYSFLSKLAERKNANNKYDRNQISSFELESFLNSQVLPSQYPETIPNKNARKHSAFNGMNISNINYDILVYDTYDYIDKVIGISLRDPLSASFFMYYEKTNNELALKMYNYIKYGTDDDMEIMLLRYGFEFEDFEWLMPCIDSIDEYEIVFNDSLSKLEETKRKQIERYYY